MNKYLVKKNISDIFRVNLLGEQIHFLNDIEFTTKKPLEDIIESNDPRIDYIWKINDENNSLTQLKELIE